jgi:hypothetical protein
MGGHLPLHPFPAVPSTANLFTLFISSNDEDGLLASLL